MKILHSKRKKNTDTNETNLQLIISTTNLIPILKMIYLITYKQKLDHQQKNRAVINTFKYLGLEDGNKPIMAYKNTENINALFILYKFKCDSE